MNVVRASAVSAANSTRLQQASGVHEMTSSGQLLSSQALKASKSRRKKLENEYFAHYTEDDDYSCEDLNCTMVEDASSRTCRLDALLSLLSSQCALIVAGQRRHPPTLSSSLQLFVNTHNHLMFADGPLAHHHRHYIALLAAEQLQCSSLVCVHRTEFLLHGGDRRWLTSSDGRLPRHVPFKLHNLQQLDRILAHRPWTIDPGLISMLRQTDGAMWSLSELTQAVVIVTHVHALSIFLAGCKLYSADAVLALLGSSNCSEPPTDELSLRIFPASNLSSTLSSSGMNKVSVIHTKKKRLQPSANVHRINEFVRSDEATFRQMRSSSQGSSGMPSVEDDSAFDDYVFNWPEHRCLLFNHLYPDIGTLLEEEFQSILSLSTGAQASTELNSEHQLHHVAITDYHTDWISVDHFDQMEASWLYVQYLFGIQRDDCDYSKVLLQLSDELKAYIKLLVCFPNRTSEKEFEHIIKAASASERIGLNLLVAEARLEAELIYALYAINRNMNMAF